MSARRACVTLRIDRSLYVYKSKRGTQAELKQRIKEICETRVRYGYRRVHVLLRREGFAVNPKRIYRLYKELGLQLRNKVPRRRVKAKLRDDRRPATRGSVGNFVCGVKMSRKDPDDGAPQTPCYSGCPA